MSFKSDIRLSERLFGHEMKDISTGSLWGYSKLYRTPLTPLFTSFAV